MSNLRKAIKVELHARNRNRERYDLEHLVKAVPSLQNYIRSTVHGIDSVDFANPNAVKVLNKAILNYYYGIDYWSFPSTNLCPSIPGRADYIHYLADLLAADNDGKPPQGQQISCLDIGTGASCIYPILGIVEYDWQFIASDIVAKSLHSAKKIVKSNTGLKGKVDFRFQSDSAKIFDGVLDENEYVDVTLCNPPFYASSHEAKKVAQRKISGISKNEDNRYQLNFGGQVNELICDGGEYKFIVKMIRESGDFASNCLWFSTLVSKKAHLKGLCNSLNKEGVQEFKIIPMKTGNKETRIIAWTFIGEEGRENWKKSRWRDTL